MSFAPIFGSFADVGASTGVTRFAAASDGNTQDVTIAGFGTPKAVLFIGTNATNDGVAVNNLMTSVGATDGTNHWVSANRSEHGVTSFEPDTDRYGATDKVIAIIESVGTALAGYATFTSFITDGVRITWNGGGTVEDHTGMLMTAIFIGGDGVSVDVGIVTLGTQNTAVTVTTGFETNALITSVSSVAFDNTFYVNLLHKLGLGSWDGATVRQVASTTFIPDNNSPVVTEGHINSSAVVPTTDPLIYGEFENITTTSFDITARGGSLTGSVVGYIAVGGVEAWAGVLDSPTSTGDHDFTGPSFRPSLGLMLPQMIDTVNVNQTDGRGSGFSVSALGGGSEFSMVWAEEQGVTQTDNQALSDDTAVHLTDHQGTQTFLASFDQFLGNGARLNFSVADGTVRKWPVLFVR